MSGSVSRAFRHVLAIGLLTSVAACRTVTPVDIAESDSGQPHAKSEIITDGRFDEWHGVPPLIDDSADAPRNSAVDFGVVHVLDDARFLHVAFAVGRPVNAQSMPGTLRVLLDVDGDVATGGALALNPGNRFDGVDLVVELSRMGRPRPGGYGAGVSVRSVGPEGEQSIESGYDVGLMVAPTAVSTRFELRLARGSVPGRAPLFTGERMRLAMTFSDAAGLRDVTSVATYELATAHDPAVTPLDPGSLTKRTDTVRVVAWNVASESLRDQPDAFRRILAALDPDVVLFDEVWGAVTRDDLETFFTTPPLGGMDAREPWRFVLGTSGGRQKNVVASRLPLRPEPTLLDVRYPPGALDALDAKFDRPRFQQLLRIEADRGVATAGAWVTLGEQDVLFVPLDLQSAGHAGSPEDRLRTLQARTIRQRLEALETENGPIAVVVAGDLNLVGSEQPLVALRQGLDVGRDLAVADAYRPLDRSQATWRNRARGTFTPGRLDFMLYTASRLTLQRTFVFDPDALDAEGRAALGIEAGDGVSSSDHLPLVGDVRLRR